MVTDVKFVRKFKGAKTGRSAPLAKCISALIMMKRTGQETDGQYAAWPRRLGRATIARMSGVKDVRPGEVNTDNPLQKKQTRDIGSVGFYYLVAKVQQKLEQKVEKVTTDKGSSTQLEGKGGKGETIRVGRRNTSTKPVLLKRAWTRRPPKPCAAT